MRIIAGEWKGCRLQAPAGNVARPTTDRVKESIFNLMGFSWSSGLALDLFAGTGALGLEAVSRGAGQAVLVDCNRKSLTAIRNNVQRCTGAKDKVEVWHLDWRYAIKRLAQENREVGWVFLDPPYAENLWPKVMAEICGSSLQVLDGVVCEHPGNVSLAPDIGTFRVEKHRQYGDIAVTIYRCRQD